jgi:SAM-dependent methyltransferase
MAQISEYLDTINDQYQAMSSRYDRVKTLPYAMVERETICSGLPDLTGRKVLDVACGTGFYSRLYKRLGAETVVGVDIVPGMVDIARAIEGEAPLGISYEVADVATLGTLGEFDVVTPIWALPYAKNADEYYEMTLNCANNLVSGGTMVALCDNPDIDVAGMSVYSRYGLTITPTDNVGDLRVVHIQMDVEPPVGFNGFHHPPGIVERSMAKAGLVDIRRRQVIAPGHTEEEPGQGYWAAIVANPPFALYTATKP